MDNDPRDHDLHDHDDLRRRESPALGETPTVVRIDGPADVLGLLPYRLGFHPSESLVVMCLDGPRKRDRLVMRVDLEPSRVDRAVAQEIAARVAALGASAVVAVVYTAERTAPRSGTRSSRGRPARAALTRALTVALDRAGIEVLEALHVRDGRWWSYLCSDPRCCPPEGTPLPSEPSPAVLAFAAELVGQGETVLVDREALRASVRPPSDPEWTQRCGAAAAEAHEVLTEALVAGGPSMVRCFVLARLADLRRAWAESGVVAVPAAAVVVLGLHDVLTRDVVITALFDESRARARPTADPAGPADPAAGPRDWVAPANSPGPADPADSAAAAGQSLGLLSALARCADDRDAAPICSVLSWVAYASGNGALATVAVERALAADPTYSLALLLVEGIDRMVPPADLRRVSALVRSDLSTIDDA